MKEAEFSTARVEHGNAVVPWWHLLASIATRPHDSHSRLFVGQSDAEHPGRCITARDLSPVGNDQDAFTCHLAIAEGS
jgi:hypothetical protein